VARIIEKEFGRRYSERHVRHLLGKAGCSLQVPKKKLAKADPVAQEKWQNETLPGIVQEAKDDGGVVLYEDEVVFQQSGTVSRTWGPKGEGVEVPSEPCRRSVKAFGAVNVTDPDSPKFHFRFATVFNAITFLLFLKQLLRAYPTRVIHIILDNARYHWAILVREWLESEPINGRIKLHFLPPYSPDFNAVEDIWRVTKRQSTHNKHFPELKLLRQTLFRRFNRFQGNPASLRCTVHRFSARFR
jgi:transposase